MERFTLKRGDTSPALRCALRPESISLNGATVQFQMRRRLGALKVSADAVIENIDPPVVRYDWDGADTDTAGSYEGEFVITYGDETIETFPNGGFIRIRIKEDVR